MSLVLGLFVLSVLLEVAAPMLRSRHATSRALLAAAAIGLLISVHVYLLYTSFSWLAVCSALISGYRILNMLRIIKGRMHSAYMWRTCLRATCWLVGTQAAVWLLYVMQELLAVPASVLWLLLAIIQCCVAAAAYITVRGHRRRTIQPEQAKAVMNGARSLPTVTVAIAARNETESLMECLAAVLASDYPKLEILVLDDCSQGRRTPDIIRAFAQQGVRFIPGAEPDTNWLARNQAFRTLAKAANGELLLFCSTGVRMEPATIRNMVAYATSHSKSMVSIMPYLLPAAGHASLIEPARRAWELLLPRRWSGRPAVANSCWLIEKAALRKAGGFEAVSRMVLPEAFFAMQTSRQADGYSFIPGAATFGVGLQKTLVEQRDSAVRTMYPSQHRRPELVAGTSVLILLLGLVPFVGVFALFFHIDLWYISLLSLLACCLYIAAYNTVLTLSRTGTGRGQAAGFPAALAFLIALEHYSMYRHEFSEVLWKDRNICVPVMHVIPHLPKIA